MLRRIHYMMNIVVVDIFTKKKNYYFNKIYNNRTKENPFNKKLTELSFDIYNSKNFMKEYDVSVHLDEIDNVYDYYIDFINDIIYNKLLFDDTKVTLIQNFLKL